MERRWILLIGGLLLVFAMIDTLRAPDDDDGDEPAKKAPEPPAAVVPCTGTASVPAHRPTGRDAVLGPVTIDGFRGSFERAKESQVFARGPAGVKVLKMPVVFAGARDVTIAVPPRQRAVVGLNFDAEAREVDTVAEAKPAVRFRACPPAAGRMTGHPGELLYGGPWPACVALDVALDGRASARHALSLGAGRCDRPK